MSELTIYDLPVLVAPVVLGGPSNNVIIPGWDQDESQKTSIEFLAFGNLEVTAPIQPIPAWMLS